MYSSGFKFHEPPPSQGSPVYNGLIRSRTQLKTSWAVDGFSGKGPRDRGNLMTKCYDQESITYLGMAQ